LESESKIGKGTMLDKKKAKNDRKPGLGGKRGAASEREKTEKSLSVIKGKPGREIRLTTGKKRG